MPAFDEWITDLDAPFNMLYTVWIRAITGILWQLSRLSFVEVLNFDRFELVQRLNCYFVREVSCWYNDMNLKNIMEIKNIDHTEKNDTQILTKCVTLKQ